MLVLLIDVIDFEICVSYLLYCFINNYFSTLQTIQQTGLSTAHANAAGSEVLTDHCVFYSE